MHLAVGWIFGEENDKEKGRDNKTEAMCFLKEPWEEETGGPAYTGWRNGLFAPVLLAKKPVSPPEGEVWRNLDEFFRPTDSFPS